MLPIIDQKDVGWALPTKFLAVEDLFNRLHVKKSIRNLFQFGEFRFIKLTQYDLASQVKPRQVNCGLNLGSRLKNMI